MPQINPFYNYVNQLKKNVAAVLDNQNVVLIAEGVSSLNDITTATVVKATPGRLCRIIVQVAGTGTGTANDCTTTAAAAITNQICVIPETVGPMATIQWPCAAGIVIVPGAGQTLSVSFN